MGVSITVGGGVEYIAYGLDLDDHPIEFDYNTDQVLRTNLFKNADGVSLDGYFPGGANATYTLSQVSPAPNPRIDGVESFAIRSEFEAVDPEFPAQAIVNVALSALASEDTPISFYLMSESETVSAEIATIHGVQEVVALPANEWVRVAVELPTGSPVQVLVMVDNIQDGYALRIADPLIGATGSFFSANTPPIVSTDPSTTTGNIKNYSLTSHASSFDPSELSGGAGQLIYDVEPFPNPERLREKTVTLVDTERGFISSTVKDVSITQSGVTVTADGLLAAFNVWNSISPYQGTLSGYLQRWPISQSFLDGISVDPDANAPIVSPGFRGNLLDHLKDILSAYTLDIRTTAGGRVFISSKTTNITDVVNVVDESLEYNTQQTARFVDVTYYDTQWGTNVEVYPNSLNENPDPFTVEANTFFTTEIRLQGGVQSVNQPSVINFVENRPYDGTNGVYSVVSASDGLPITAAEWTAAGGHLTVELTDDPSVLRVNITGANIPDKSPFRVGAMSSGNIYPALRITGTGARTNPKTIRLYTGVPETETGDEVGATITNPFINTIADALNAGQHAANRLSGTAARASSSARFLSPVADDLTAAVGIKYRRGNSNYRVTQTIAGSALIQWDSVSQNTWGDFESENPGLTWGEFETSYGGNWRNFIPVALQDWKV